MQEKIIRTVSPKAKGAPIKRFERQKYPKTKMYESRAPIACIVFKEGPKSFTIKAFR